jgi:hypothetical protein
MVYIEPTDVKMSLDQMWTRAIPAREETGNSAQARTVGLMLLTVVAIGLTVALAAFSFALTPTEGEDLAVASIDVEIADDNVTVIHRGGESFQPEELELQMNGGQRRVTLSAFSTQPADIEQFSAGQSWTHSATFTSDEVFVAVVHEPTGTVLARASHTF